MTKTEKKNDKMLELGDIISLDAPTNPEWHQQVFFISYIDDEIIKVIHTESSFSYIWNRQTDLANIKKITVLERSSLKGYAKQNGLYPHIWIDIYFGGETPRSLTAEITNLEEDMIELTTYPENQVLYIDFAYQGIPRNLPIVKICVREKPASFRRGVFSPEEGEGEGESKEGEASMEYLENGFINIVLPTQYQPDENYHDHLQKIYGMEEDEEGEELEEIVQQLEIPPEQQHFGLEAQVNDLLDAFLSTIPDFKRTPAVMNRIYTHIQRFKELRENYSVFDPIYHQIVGIKRPLEKPIVNHLAELRVSLPWIIPVVSQKKKIFYDDEDAGAGDMFLSKADETKEPELIQINQDTEYADETQVENETFYKNNVPQSTVKYANMHLQTAMYESAFETYPEFGLHTSLVNTDMDVLISNDDSLYSKTIREERIFSKRFAFQRYNQEINYVKSRGKENASFATLYPPDSLSFRSLFILPESFITFSKIKLPNTSILSKSLLNTMYPYYFALLNKKTHVLEKEIYLGNEESESVEIKSAFQHIYLSRNDETAESMDSKDKMNTFLQRAIPSLSSIVETFLNKQKGVFSFLQAVDMLEPFLIYMEDIPWKVANTIKQLLYKNIDRYNTETALKTELFKTLLLEKYKFEGNNEWKNDKVTEKYVKRESSTESEWLNYLLNYDQGRFYWNHLKRENLELYVPEFLLPEIENKEEDTDSKKCWKRVISKKYVNFNDLKEDNNKAIFFDKALDTTDYSLVANDKKENEDEFIDYWSQTLTAKYGFTSEHALNEAQILFKGEKPVVDGDYAVLEQTPNLPSDLDQMTEEEQKEIALESNVKKRTMYFVRKNKVWVHEPDLDEYSFMDSTDLLCNIDPKCVSQKGSCASDTELLNRFKNLDREKIRKEFESRYDISKEDFSKKYEKEETFLSEWLENEGKIRQHVRTFTDYKAFEYGKRAVLQEFIESPFIPLRNSILQKHLDFVTKQKYIVLFVEKFCREPILDEPMRESEHWKYCKETNTKLMPTSLFQLAKAYSEDLNLANTIPVKYNAVLNQLCNTVGKLSDDGDAYIDKHSGYILRKIEMREEGFDIGFGDEGEGALFQESEPKMSETIIKQVAKNEVVKIYTNEIDQRLYNIISAICRNIYVYGEENKERMMQLCSQWLKIGSFFPSETTYQSQVDKIMKKREADPKIKIPDTYAVYIKKKHILIATLSVLIIVQTAIPEIPIDRTFSGCVKSFDGYPLKDGQDDLSSITYFACVLKKMYVAKEDASLLPKGKGELENVLLKTLKDPILLQPAVMNLYDLKRNYLLENPVSLVIPRALEIEQKWPHFLPPITPFTVPAKLIQAINPGGQSVLNVYQVKIRTCSLALVQYIREMVSKKNILFQTKTGFPFLQNACCDEILQFPPKSVLEYFFEDAAIEKMVGILKNLSLKIATIQHKIKAKTIQKESELIVSSSSIESSLKKRNVIYSYEPILYYATLIHYCKLNSDIYPIPPELERFCNKKPSEMSTDIYDPKSSILEKMHFLEKHQVKMDAVKTIDLMNIINQRNPVEIIQSIDISHKQKMQSSLDRFREINSDLPSLDSYMTFFQENNFAKANISLKTQLLSFIGRNASVKLTPTELNVAVKPLYFYNPDIPIQNLANHMKSLVYRFGIIYPCFLQQDIARKGMPLYWELLPEDAYYLFKNTKTYFDILQPFVKNPLILPIFQNCVERIRPLLEYMEYSHLSEDYYEMAIFMIHVIFSIWMALMNHPDIYKTVTRSVRENLENDQEENRLRSESNSQLMVDEIEEIDITSIQIEQRDEIQQCLADLFLQMFTTIQTKKQINAKEAVMMSYADIMREVDFSKDREKQRLKDRFKKMGTDERKAENILKKLHLGDFAVDMKNINKYGKTTDLLGDRDEEEAEAEAEAEFMETENDDANIDDIIQNIEEEDMEDMNEYAYENYEESGYGEE